MEISTDRDNQKSLPITHFDISHLKWMQNYEGRDQKGSRRATHIIGRIQLF